MPVGIFSEAENGSVSEERQKERMETGPGHACTDSGDGVFFSPAHLPIPYLVIMPKHGKWRRMTPHGYLFRLYRVEGSVRPTAGM